MTIRRRRRRVRARLAPMTFFVQQITNQWQACVTWDSIFPNPN